MRKPKVILFIQLCLCVNASAHSPDLSSLMIYEQGGTRFLAIRSSLTAFEGEVEFHFNKNAYKTPEEFRQLVLKRFVSSCLLVVNGDTVGLVRPAVILGHETKVFAELPDFPKEPIRELHVRNRMFADIHNSQCELILVLEGSPKRQHILDRENGHEVALRKSGGEWVVDENEKGAGRNTIVWLVGLVCLSAMAVGFIYKRKLQ